VKSLATAALAAAELPADRWARRTEASGEVWLRADGADTALQARLLALPASELAGGFKPCRTP
jgi:hypothetical protein